MQLTVHQEGKILPDYYSHDRFDRLPIVVTGLGIEKLLCAPALKKATGIAQATAAFDAVVDWGLQENIVAKCTDTQTQNTGEENGASKKFDNLMNKMLLCLACRHHVHELRLDAVVAELLGPFTSPEVPLFKEFREFWPQVISTRTRCSET